ncbi:hypothetical protein FA95DRAFT_1568927 [Auriscalpium vulgare]|uniref:Uncharacterized protein n=1 Tax=Auriscalpium vulgare TaxID=40419 RepID=A0ACB8S9W3_9AGAM|nr:hypothetical protein FA95DRAFT_1568927 [Auriscalpium vulgare]
MSSSHVQSSLTYARPPQQYPAALQLPPPAESARYTQSPYSYAPPTRHSAHALPPTHAAVADFVFSTLPSHILAADFAGTLTISTHPHAASTPCSACPRATNITWTARAAISPNHCTGIPGAGAGHGHGLGLGVASNPDAPVLEARARDIPNDAVKATRALGGGQRTAADQALREDIAQFLRDREDAIQVIATTHSVTPKKVRDLVNAVTHFKTPRAPNFENALVHMKTVELNAERPEGRKLTLVDIKAAVASDPTLRNVTPKRKEEIMGLLSAHREEQKIGIRVSHKSAAQDVMATGARWTTEAENLYSRTGARSFTFITRSDINDTIQPSWMCGGDASGFFLQQLKQDPNDIARLFELWSVSIADHHRTADSLASMRKEASDSLLSGLPPAQPNQSAQAAESLFEDVESLDTHTTAWARANPDAPILEARARNIPNDAVKATRALGGEQRTAADQALRDDIAQFLREREAAINVIADKHAITNKKVRDLVNAVTHFKTPRAPNFGNALVHLKTVELNADLPEGRKMKLADIKAAVANDPELQDITPERKREIMDLLSTHREEQKIGIRVSHKSAAQDVMATGARWTAEAENLYSRTGARSFTFITRSDINDTIQPSWMCGGDASGFFLQQLKQDPNDIARLFELWSVSIADHHRTADSLASMRKETSDSLLSGLRYAAQTSKIAMNYDDYDNVIVAARRVMLVGWPAEIPFCKPGALSRVDELRTLRDAVQTGACKWVRLTNRQVTEHLKSQKAKGTAPEKRPRKVRSDKGTTKGRKRDADDIAEGSDREAAASSSRPSKKARVAQGHRAVATGKGKGKEKANGKARLPKSAEWVASSDESDNDNDDYDEDM